MKNAYKGSLKVVLIGNYEKDRQESMLRFAEMLSNGFLAEKIDCQIWKPIIFFGILTRETKNGFSKWIGYIDKWIVFPLIIRSRLFFYRKRYRNSFFHICDHSNAPYLAHLPKQRTSITCHDVIAIKASMGYDESNVDVSFFGKFLQKWILKHLRNVKFLAAVSNHTFEQVKYVTGKEEKESENWRVIYNAFNADYSAVISETDEKLLDENGIRQEERFILHVGSNHPRKNRKLLIDMFGMIGRDWDGKLCFAGERITNEMEEYAERLGVKSKILSIEKPPHDVLSALYRRCDVFIFPSFAEGFGWPVIEAQACGAPVIASNVEPMPEIGSDGALYCDPYKPECFLESFNALKNQVKRNLLITNGFKNCLRFSPSAMIKEYQKLFQEAR